MSCEARATDLLIPQGTSYRVQWPIQDTDGNAVSLVGYSARAQARKTYASADALYEWTTDDGSIAIVDNTVTLIVEPGTSAEWDWRHAYYDIELVSTDGSVSRIAKGQIQVDPEVTR